MGKLKIGIDLHNRASVFMPQQGLDYDLNRLIDLAVLCEELGFYSVSVGDSLLAKPRWRAIPTMAAIAAKTSRIKIASHIMMPHLYNNPVLLAQELATLDVISKGRIVLGCGIGAGRTEPVEHEHRLCGVPRQRRGKALEECLYLLKRLWTEEEVTHHGQFWALEGVRLGLKPHQRPHPPIWIAAGAYLSQAGIACFGVHERPDDREGFKLAPVERVARLGDGWVTTKATSEEYRSGLATIRQLASEKYGRDPRAIQAVYSRGVYISPDVDAAYREVKWWEDSYHNMPLPEDTIRRWTIFGNPDECVKQMQPFAEVGVEVFIICVRARDFFAQVRAIAKEILPAFT
ncbi:MAG: LLM class flavin-dependent oxidoreductase [Deltaproteobacteria bacterium]|nr:LLM class flavin-dependent oxidoreductase [Deltaproteobacteria bacterium]